MCAVIRRGILGGFSNKIGNIVGTSWKGIAVMKSLPLSVANPRTTAQVTQRSRFTTASKFGSILLADIVKPLWDRFAQEESGFNAFVQTNQAIMSDGLIDSTDIFVISKGKMSAVEPTGANFTSPADTIVITWPTTLPDQYAAATDRAYVVVYAEGEYLVKGYASVAARSAGTATVTFSTTLEPPLIHVYLAFKRVDGTVVSNTGYLQAT